jgi:hypothetical protein
MDGWVWVVVLVVVVIAVVAFLASRRGPSRDAARRSEPTSGRGEHDRGERDIDRGERGSRIRGDRAHDELRNHEEDTPPH